MDSGRTKGKSLLYCYYKLNDQKKKKGGRNRLKIARTVSCLFEFHFFYGCI